MTPAVDERVSVHTGTERLGSRPCGWMSAVDRSEVNPRPFRMEAS